ncbi:hypothetical protein QT238_15595 [Geobacillus stearothermophilus]|nr:hypothetical protein QT238_15595 [Geobacillus stearothermophilus]
MSIVTVASKFRDLPVRFLFPRQKWVHFLFDEHIGALGNKGVQGEQRMKQLKVMGMALLLFWGYSSAASADTEIKPPSSVKEVVAKFSEPKEMVANELVVKFKEGVTEKQREALLRPFRAAELSFMDIGNFSLIKAPKGMDLKGLAAKLVKLPEIESVEPNYIIERNYTPSDPGYSKQWHLKKINAPKAWDTTRGRADYGSRCR